MASHSPRPQLFDVMPAGELHRALRQSLPADTKVIWHQLGSIHVTGGKIGAVDAASLHPRYPSEIKTLDWPHPQAEIWLQLAMKSNGEVDRVFAVLVSAPGQGLIQPAGQWELVEGPTLAIDSATAAVGDYARMLSQMQGGGPASQVCLGRGDAKEPSAKAAREQAAALLQQHGFPAHVERWERTGGLSVTFKPGLTEEQIVAANALLKQAGFTDEVWLAGSHTSGVLADALVKSPVTHLDDQLGSYLVACQTGFGDGMYYWDGIVRAGKLCGYVCNFIPADEDAATAAKEGAIEAEVIDSEPLPPTRPAPPRSTAPALVPGVIIAVRLPYDTFCIARVEQQLPGGFGVQFVTGERAQVAAANVVSIPGHPVFQVGDDVLALWQGGAMDRGRITATSQQGYIVAWNDGTPPQVVALGTLTFWEWTK